MSLSVTLLASAVAMAVLFQATYLVGRRLNNFGIVDAVWSLSFAPLAGLIALLGSGLPWRRGLLFGLAAAWSLRLGLHLTRRIAAHHPQEDTRYAALRHTWRDGFATKMALFYQGQAVSVLVLGLPYFFIAQNASATLQAWEVGGLAVWALGWIVQAVADHQLKHFQQSPEGKTGVCNRGLWRFSRHPNYFGEWLGWLGLALLACALPWGWVALLSPAVMLHLLLNVTGVPLTEERSLAKRGEAYRRYQATTSKFFPWFPRPHSVS